ncbi:O-antigen ligase family protein [Falsiroseomonas sp. CW058]|uniref:O-antigen ligase family protein n=1 Tax=Falsiroseomonas sp. CW058 TaxID=3388664 RepID=UPI003D317E4A
MTGAALAAPAISPGAGVVAAGAGAAAAVMQLAGALKTAPPLAALPFDLTLLAFAMLLPFATLLAATRRWHVDPAIALPVAAAALLWLWLVVAGSWSPSRLVAARKLPDIALLAPAMLAAGMLVGADAGARRAFCAVTLAIGAGLGGVVAWGALVGWAPRVAADAELARLQYQVAGLAMAMAGGLAALRAAEARGPAPALGWSAVVLALAAAAMLPGGRAALGSLGLCVAAVPALRLWLGGRRGAALLWLAGCGAVAAVALAGLLLRPGLADGLRTVRRLAEDGPGLDTRLGLWSAALGWAGQAAPFGLGTGGFSIAAGFGEWRGRYPHNHLLEAMAEGGLPGLVLWLAAFGGAALAAGLLLRRVEPGRAARIGALALPVAASVMVSTDLGNRMAWFALGLGLSLGLRAAAPARA